MRLLYSPYSPFARKVRVVAREKGLIDRVNETVVDPFGHSSELLELTPLSKVPALETEDGPIFDSPLICEYLEGLSAEHRLMPDTARSRLAVLCLQALADGVMDAAVACVLEKRRTDTTPSAHWLARWEGVIGRAVQAIAQADLPESIRLDGIAVACALAHVSFRLPAINWQAHHPGLATWFSAYSNRRSFHETAFPAT
jgi:glutathione S-transferase